MRLNVSSNAPLVLAEGGESPRPVVVAHDRVAHDRRRARDRQRARHATVLTAAVVLLAAAALLEVRGQSQVALFGAALPELCFLRRMLGWNCPGCGLTRSFVSLAHGDLAAAWRFHWVGPALFIAVAFQLPYRGLKLWRLARRK